MIRYAKHAESHQEDDLFNLDGELVITDQPTIEAYFLINGAWW
jgi:hypothetical protein